LSKFFQVLDTFIALEDSSGFETAVRKVIEHVTFDVDTKPQVFEITIRVLGGLLSGHIYASDPKSAYKISWYRGQLLRLAHNLGERLLPAFRTSTGIPYARVRLVFLIKYSWSNYLFSRPIYVRECQMENQQNRVCSQVMLQNSSIYFNIHQVLRVRAP
jgi:hypothetical protein